MKGLPKRDKWIGMIVGLVLIGMAISRLLDPEPRYASRKLSAWLDDPTLTESDIRRVVRAIGPNAIPKLEIWLVEKPSLLERSLGWLGRHSVYFSSGYQPSLDANFRAMRGFFMLGDMAEPAVPWLETGAARKDGDYEFYLKTLAVCGTNGVRALDRLKSGLTPGETKSYINALAYGVGHASTLRLQLGAALQSFLNDPDPVLRQSTLWAVRDLRGRCPPELLTALQLRSEVEKDDGLRATAKLFALELANELNRAKPVRTTSSPAPVATRSR